MRRFKRALMAIVCALLFQSTALALSETSPGPYNTYDAAGNLFESQHFVEYDWLGYGVYTKNTQLYVNVLRTSDRLDCGWVAVDYQGATDQRFRRATYPFPLDYWNTPTWWYEGWWATHQWVNGNYVKYRQKAGEVGDYTACNGYQIPWLAGWESDITSSHQWVHYHLTW